MTSKKSLNAILAAEAIAYLTRLGRRQGSAVGLTSAQWAALRYFSRANRISRTLSAFADYHVTTRGTASQTVNSLIKKGFLKRMPSLFNGRSSQIDLTAKGNAESKMDPFDGLVLAFAELPKTQLSEMVLTLEHIMLRMAGDQRRPIIGTCLGCQHLEETEDKENGEKTHFCNFINYALQHSEIRKLCINYTPDSSRLKR